MYVNGQKRTFEVSATKMLVKSETFAATEIQNMMQRTAVGNIRNVYELCSRLTMVDVQSTCVENILELQSQWSSKEGVVFVSPVFVNEMGREIGGFTNQILIRLKNINDYSLLAKIASFHQIKDIVQCEFDELVHLLTLEKGSVKNAMQAANELFRTGLFEYAEPNLIHFIELTANDRHFQQQWGLHHNLFGIRAPQAWTITTGSPDIRIAILDTGVDLNHPDLRPNFVFIPPNNTVLGFDATGNSSNGASTDLAHGTASAGIAAARGNNNIGIAGVAHSSRILPVRVATRAVGWDVTESNFIRIGIEWAVANGADVISMSFTCDETDALNTAIVNAASSGRVNNLGTVLVAGSGNVRFFPVAYPAKHANVISVGATDNQGYRAPFSSHGQNLNIVAPGVNIFTTGMLGGADYETVINDGINGVYFTSYTGTSPAAPHVAGVAALILSVNPDLKAQQVRNIIEYTANRELPNWIIDEIRSNGAWNYHLGHGLVDAYAAVLKALEMICVADFINQPPITTDRTVFGCTDLEVQNIAITNGATLTLRARGDIYLYNVTIAENSRLILNAGGDIIVGGDIIIYAGGELEIR